MNRTVLALETLHNEVSYVTHTSHDQGREFLNDLEVEHLIKMTSDIVEKIVKQTKEVSQ